MTSINPHIFRAYDIRGKADIDITPELCRLVGRGFGSELRERYKIEHPKVVVGFDARTHSPAYAEATIEGLTSTGCIVSTIGMTPSPLDYFTVCTGNFDGSIQITASHNPKEDNGLKLQTRHAEAFSDQELQKLLQRIQVEKFVDGVGDVKDLDAISPYLEFLTKMFHGTATGLHVVVDSGNGAAGPVYCEALRRAGAVVTELFTEPDGTFPNHIADPSKHSTLKDLQETVLRENADIGLAFDGDGDRFGAVDELGAIRSPDEILLLLARDVLSRNPKTSVVFTVSNSSILDSEVTRLGGKPIMCKVGHSFVEHAMNKADALIGGEQSGHFFCFENYFHFDDALVAALHLLKIRTAEQKPLSKIFNEFPKVFSEHEIRPMCPDDKKADVIKNVTEYFQGNYEVNTLDGARIDFGDGAWAGIRMSNTSPRLSICMEARSEEKLDEVRSLVMDHMKSYPEIVWE